MELSVSKVLKISNTNDSRVVVLSVRRIGVVQQSSVRIQSATNIIILNVPGEKRYIWSS